MIRPTMDCEQGRASVQCRGMAARQTRTLRYVAALLLWLFFAQVATAARETSITLDEPLHIASGYACLLTGDYRLVEEHPPLLKMLQAAPLLLAIPPLQDPRTSAGWEASDLIEVAREIVVDYQPIDALVFAARVPTMLVGVLLGATIYRWTADLAARPRRSRPWWAPLLALLLYAFDPNMLAHSAIAATDLGAAAAIVAALYTFWRWLRSAGEPQVGRALMAAVMLGAALGVKNTALLLGPAYVMMLWRGRPRGSTARYFAQGGLIAVGAFLTLWAIYRFEVRTVAGLPFAIPAASHALPLVRLQEHMREGHSAFLMGQNYHHGDWRYFLVALTVKTPLLTLAFGMWGALNAAAAGRWRRAGSVTGLSLWLFPALYFAASLASGINIGYRHLLPILPFGFIFIAMSLEVGFPLPRAVLRIARAALLVLLLGYVAVTLRLHPWHLAYFNVLAGGPDGGYRYLVDSNLDWGQTWKALREYLVSRDITAFYLSNYTINDPRVYGLDYTPLPPWPEVPPVLPQRYNPPPGIYAISSTQLQGVVVADPEMFDYFRKLEPVARIGHAMFVYEIAPTPAIEWVAQCSIPVPPLLTDALREGFGIGEEVPLLTFDCSQSWIVPQGNGRYVLSRDPTPDWAPLRHARLAYEQTQTGWVPPYAVYEYNGADPVPSVRAGRAIAVGTVLTYVGYEAPRLVAGETAVVETWWRIEAKAHYPLSLMAHLVNSDGAVIAVGDALGVAHDQWLAGSLLIQRHTFAVPFGSAPGPYELWLGAYTLPDVQRLPVLASAGAIEDYLVAGVLEVEAP